MTSAWLDTSIAHTSTSRSRITANSACRSGASGVVSADSTRSPLTQVPIVPITAVRRPAAARAPESSCVVVVLPWVPVTPTRVRALAGEP